MWNYQDKPYAEIDNNRYLGFIYLIDNITNGKSYIGQKLFWYRRGKTYRESDWRDYTGSSRALNQDIADGHQISKSIIRFCVTKNEMNYHEAKAIFDAEALLNPEQYYNGWINMKVSGKDKAKWAT